MTAARPASCPLRPASMTLDRDHPRILQSPEHPSLLHDARHTGAERGFAGAQAQIDLICVPQLMSGEPALAAQIGSYLKSVYQKCW